jgi:hypothetical protein
MLYPRLVNQHLSSAQLILDELEHRADVDDTLQRAFQHSALYLLNSAYLCQLRAIAENYRCSDMPVINAIKALQAALVSVDIPAPEAREIEVLVNEGWLGELLQAHRQLCLPETAPLATAPMPGVSQSDITLRDESREQPAPKATKLRQWMLALEELVQRQSEMMAEY